MKKNQIPLANETPKSQLDISYSPAPGEPRVGKGIDMLDTREDPRGYESAFKDLERFCEGGSFFSRLVSRSK
jgi:hypothetical protein